MFSTSSHVNTPVKLLERMQNSKIEFDADFSVSLFDQAGNSLSGIFESVDTNANIATLIDEYQNAIFFNVKFISHLVIHNSDKHSDFIAGNIPSKKQTKTETINLKEKIDLLVEMLNKNYRLPLTITFDESYHYSNVKAENISILLDCLSENIRELASDDFTMSALKKVSGFNFESREDIKFNMRMSDSIVYITTDFDEQLPKNINHLVEKGLNNTL